MTQNSITSKPSTESDTATRKTSRWFRLAPRSHLLEFDGLLDLYWGGPERRITRLTLRIIGINAAALLILLVGIVYLGQYQNSLIETRLQTFKNEVELVSSALSEEMAHPEKKSDEVIRRMIWRFSQTMDQHIYLFNADQKLQIDSKNLPSYDDVKIIKETRPPPLYTVQVLKSMAKMLLKILPTRRTLPQFPKLETGNAADFPGVPDAFEGRINISAWENNKNVLFVATAPLRSNHTLYGAVMLLREGDDIAQDIGAVWSNILMAFILTLIITILLSIYLSGAIARPLRKLANAAEAVRRGKSKDTEIPDLSARKDEIGELSIVLREMTQALWDRMDSIEHFAADVAHELKNPLTSLRSAVETVSIVKKDKDREKLLEIIKHDVERMDRLISDISSASRLDSELSREALEPVDIRDVVNSLLETYTNPLLRKAMPGNPKDNGSLLLSAHLPHDGDLHVWGLRGRIFQVLDNLVSNAFSFSPDGGKVTINVRRTKKTITILIEDEGPGIPENKLETIFERFYTERPEHEAYGRHSGLGLSICRQIVTALGGKIFAENIHARDGRVYGARFTVILNSA